MSELILLPHTFHSPIHVFLTHLKYVDKTPYRFYKWEYDSLVFLFKVSTCLFNSIKYIFNWYLLFTRIYKWTIVKIVKIRFEIFMRQFCKGFIHFLHEVFRHSLQKITKEKKSYCILENGTPTISVFSCYTLELVVKGAVGRKKCIILKSNTKLAFCL